MEPWSAPYFTKFQSDQLSQRTQQLCKEEIIVDSVKAALERSMVMAAVCSLDSALVLNMCSHVLKRAF